MAVAVPDPRQAPSSTGATSEVFGHVSRLLSGLWSIPSVQRVAASVDVSRVDLWVFMRQEAPDDEARIFQLGREYRNAVGPALPFDMHVYPLSEIDVSLFPPAETLFER